MAYISYTIDPLDRLPYPLAHYIKRYAAFTVGCWSLTMGLGSNGKEIHDVPTGRKGEAAVGALIKRWWH